MSWPVDRDKPGFYKVSLTQNENPSRLQPLSLSQARLAAVSAIRCTLSCGSGFSWIFNYPSLISKLVFYAKTNNNNRQ